MSLSKRKLAYIGDLSKVNENYGWQVYYDKEKPNSAFEKARSRKSFLRNQHEMETSV